MPPVETFAVNTFNQTDSSESRKTADQIGAELNKIHEDIIRRNGQFISSLLVEAREVANYLPMEHILVSANIPDSESGA